MSIEDSIKKTEEALISSLEAKRSAIDDRTGKGAATEAVVEEQLLVPHLPPRFRCSKGAVVASTNPHDQSPAIDRVIYDPSVASPLVFDKAHSIFPIESVCGLVEITMHLDAPKLRHDIEHMVPLKAMRTRRYLKPSSSSRTKVERVEQQGATSPRSFIVGLPADRSWSARAIAQTLRQTQLDLGHPTYVHGLYVIGVGFFQTETVDPPGEQTYRILAWTGPDRLFRFATGFRLSFERWGRLPSLWAVDLQGYVQGQSEVMAE